jgi:phage-related protein
VKTWLAQLPTQTAYFVGQMIGKFVQLLATLPSKIEQVWNQIITNLKAFAQRFITEGANTVKEFAQRFIDGLKELPSRVMEIGGDIVNGIKDGITGAWDSVTSMVSNMASSLVQGFKDSFKIGSPSKLMRDEVGQWIPAGIAEGIKAGMGVLDESVNAMTTSISPNVMQSVTPYSGTGGSLYDLLATYLPVIASGENVHVSLDVSNERLFRIVQTEQRRNTQLVGVNG